MTKLRKKIVILISGNGTNAQAIIEACINNEINADVVAVISNKATAFGLQRAANFGVTNKYIEHQQFKDREAFDHVLLHEIEEHSPDLIVLAGFMRILSANFVNHFAGRLINIHPSILPKYPGLNTHQRAIEAKDKWHGASVHFVTDELDGGPIILSSRVNISENDDAKSLADKVAQTEWQIYPLVIKWFCENRLKLCKHNVILDEKEVSKSGLVHEKV